MDEFVKIGTWRPVKNAQGHRPVFDEAGERRECECEPYERLEGLSIKVDPGASAGTRRYVEGTIDQLSMALRDGGLATSSMLNLEAAYRSITKQTVVAIRNDATGVIKEDAATLETMFDKHAQYADIFPILGTIRHALSLSNTKKKSWNSLFA